MQAKQIYKWNTSFSIDPAGRRELNLIKERFREVTGQFLSISVILRRALSLMAHQIGTMTDEELRQEWSKLSNYAEGRP